MKKYYSEKCWKIILDIIEDIQELNAVNEQMNDNTLKEKCCALAYYNVNDESSIVKKTKQELHVEEMNGEIFNSYFFIIVARNLLLKELVNNEQTNNIRVVFETLHAYLGNGYYFKTESEIVKQIILYGYMFTKKYNFLAGDKHIKQIAESANYLKSHGISICVENESIKYSEEIEEEIFNLLDKKIVRIGGIDFYVDIIQRFVAGNYVGIFDRYLLTRKIDNERNEPVNFLLQLSGRHLQDHCILSGEKKKNLIDEIILIAEALLDISNVQGESVFEYSSMDVHAFPYYLKSEMYFDKLCIPMQYSKEFILKSMDYLIGPWFEYAQRKYSYKDYRKVAEYILSIKCFNNLLEPVQIKQKTGIAKYKIDQILEDISMPVIKVNAEYTSINAPTNLFSRPLIKIPLRGYYMIDQHFSGIGFYLAAYDMIKENYQLLDRKQGTEVEKILHDEMSKKGYKVLTGKYPDMNGIVGRDCDLVLDEKYLYFFEIKKRSITDEFNSLDDVAVLKSLSNGMIKAQLQAFSHELYLRKNKQLNLDNGKYIISYNDKQLPTRKISVCFSEYSYLTSKIFSMTLLETLLLCNVNAVDEMRQNELDFLNKYGKVLQDIIKQFGEEKIQVREIVFPSLFCSLQQVLTAVWCTDTEKQFVEIVREWIYRQDKALDPYLNMLVVKNRQLHPEDNDLSKQMLEIVEERMPNCMIIGGI